jgi:hypothetical protein
MKKRTAPAFNMGSFTTRLYILDGKTPVRCHDVAQWAAENAKGLNPDHGAPWRVGLDRVGEYEISTVFLGINMNNGLFGIDNTNPVLFETMLFGPDGDMGGMGRSSTFDVALERHRLVVERVRIIVEANTRMVEGKKDE